MNIISHDDAVMQARTTLKVLMRHNAVVLFIENIKPMECEVIDCDCHNIKTAHDLLRFLVEHKLRIDNCFIFNKTKQGYQYWNHLALEWLKLYKEKIVFSMHD